MIVSFWRINVRSNEYVEGVSRWILSGDTFSRSGYFCRHSLASSLWKRSSVAYDLQLWRQRLYVRLLCHCLVLRAGRVRLFARGVSAQVNMPSWEERSTYVVGLLSRFGTSSDWQNEYKLSRIAIVRVVQSLDYRKCCCLLDDTVSAVEDWLRLDYLGWGIGGWSIDASAVTELQTVS